MNEATPLPEGTVTFLFTDIEGSTRLWEQHPEAMREALARHDALLTAGIQQQGGVVVKSRGEGDSFFAVFARATDALTAACALQQALLAEPWPPPLAPPTLGGLGGLRVRMALHVAAAELREGDYYGPGVNRCARLRAVAHGGQVLLSQAACDRVRETLPEGASLRDLGAHRLKDLQQPEHLFQLLHPALPADFPALRSLEAFTHNLPRQLTSFIGREREIAVVKQLLETTSALSLTGSGGGGKTRLALQVAAELVEAYADGIWLVELAALADPALVPQAVASALGLREEPGRPLVQTLADYLRLKSLLLLLDNCEHLLLACAQLADHLLRSCHRLRILASSREGLGIAGERTYRVPSLAMPGAGERPSAQRLSEYEAVQLFRERAAFHQPTFAVTERNAGVVAQVCQRLDGIPLAIELAAARVKALAVDQIAARLDDRFRLLTGGSRTALPRQQTLRALIDWSHDLLTGPEQALFRRLSVFAGGWTLEAAEAVGAGEGIEEWEVLDLLTALVEKSLVQYTERGGEERYRLPETVRQYARDRLLEAGEAAAVQERHRDWVLALAEQGSLPEESERAWLDWLDRLEREHDNVRAALAWSGAQGDGAVGLRLGEALWPLWMVRGYAAEGREHFAGLLSLPGAEARTAARARALRDAGTLAHRQGDYGAAWALLEESLAIYRELGDKNFVAWSLWDLGWVARDEGDHGAARALLEESLALFRELGNKRDVAWSLWLLGSVVHAQGDHGAARALIEESLVIYRELGTKLEIAYSLNNLGWVAHGQGDNGEARAFFRESLASGREAGHKRLIAQNLEGLAALAVALAQCEQAARLFGAAEGLREALGVPLPPADRVEQDRCVAAARTALGEEAFTAAWAAGLAMSLDEAVAYALEETRQG